MARVKNNILVTGVSGKFNKQVIYKQYGETTIMSSYPDMSKVKASKAQQGENTKFAQAMAFARKQMAVPESKAAYKAKIKGMQRAHNVAVADFYNAPVVEAISITDLKGKKGDIIEVIAKDDFKVISVDIQLLDKEGVLIDSGAATDVGKGLWKFTLLNDYPTLATIYVEAKDTPGNVGSKSINF